MEKLGYPPFHPVAPTEIPEGRDYASARRLCAVINERWNRYGKRANARPVRRVTGLIEVWAVESDLVNGMAR